MSEIRAKRTLHPLTEGVRVLMTPEMKGRLQAVAERYGLAVGAMARLAVEAGLAPASERLRSAKRRESERESR